jgi:hypothetical protein
MKGLKYRIVQSRSEMASVEKTAKAAKTSGLLLLLLAMIVVPLFVYSSVPRASAWNTSTQTSTKTSTATTTFSGDAFGASITAPVVGSMTFADTGALPSTGGERDNHLVAVTFPSGGGAAMFDTVTMGFDNTAQSHATTDKVSLSLVTLEGTVITADFVMANSLATCTATSGPIVSGSSDISALVVDGMPIAVTPAPNQVFGPFLGGVIVTVNEQITTPNSITVNALHVTASGFDIIISSAHSDITCAAPCQHVQHDFVTGGGWIPVSGDKGTFGFVAGHKDGSSMLSGHLTYIDHSTGMKVHSTDVTSYSVDALTRRTFGGDTTINGISYTYSVTIVDNGEPGAGHDTFSIQVSNGYSASGTLGGGNVEIHN